jgi:hypothetical protein
MSTIAQRTENFKELYKQHLISIGDSHECENCKVRREGQIKALGSNAENLPELMSLSEEDHYNVILKVTETQIALVEHYSQPADPIKEMLKDIFGGVPGLEIEVLTPDQLRDKMQSEPAPIIPLNNGGNTHC